MLITQAHKVTSCRVLLLARLVLVGLHEFLDPPQKRRQLGSHRRHLPTIAGILLMGIGFRKLPWLLRPLLWHSRLTAGRIQPVR